MMRESVSHPVRTRAYRFQWGALVGVGALTVLTGIAVLMALMSPENLKAVPTVALVCVLILLCVPAPVLMLEWNRRRIGESRAQIPVAGSAAGPIAEPRAITHGSHIPHNTHPDTHRTMRTTATTPHRESAPSTL